ncbi:MAG: Ig-like domain-containing protein [bacterium]
MKSNRLFLWTLLFLLFLGTVSCSGTTSSPLPGSGPGTNPAQGGTEFGNPTTVSGTVQPPQTPTGTTPVLIAPCGADTAVAENAEGQTHQAAIAKDCHFFLSLPPQEGYSIHFEAKGKFIAKLLVNPADPFPLYNFFLSASGTSIDMGKVQLTGNLAVPSQSPLSQLDRDQDGLTDANDPDDDNDGIADADERDCDFDGFIDDDDPNSSCSPPGSNPSVLSVSPFNGETAVPSNEKVQARFSCPMNQALFNGASFIVKPTAGSVFIPCVFSFSSDSRTITCDHSASPFAPNTPYLAILAPLDCQDGSKTPSLTWSWTTSP